MTDHTELKRMAEHMNDLCGNHDGVLMHVTTAAVLALIAENEAMNSAVNEWQDLAERRAQRMIALDGENEALRKDGERWRFMIHQADPADWEYISHQIPAVAGQEVDALIDKFKDEQND